MAGKMNRVLITGAAGGIGKGLRQLLKGIYPELRLSDRVAPNDLAEGEVEAEAARDAYQGALTRAGRPSSSMTFVHTS